MQQKKTRHSLSKREHYALPESRYAQDPAPIHIYRQVAPKFSKEVVFTLPTVNSEVHSRCIQEYHIWSLARVEGSSGEKQLVPGFGGFFSAMGVQPTRKSIIYYFTPINQPFSKFSVMKELLRWLEDATMDVSRAYVLNTIQTLLIHPRKFLRINIDINIETMALKNLTRS